jgi:hypothetical protein
MNSHVNWWDRAYKIDAIRVAARTMVIDGLPEN